MKEQLDLIERALQIGEFRIFTQLVEAAGLTQTLKHNGPYTVFAPTDAAFLKVPTEKMRELSRAEHRYSLEALVRNHVVHGKLMSKDLKRIDETKSAEGDELKIESRDDLWVNEAKVTLVDLGAANGVLHGIDTVLKPEGQASMQAGS